MPQHADPTSIKSFAAFTDCLLGELLLYGVNAEDYGCCLCEYKKIPYDEGFDVAIVHPHRSEECYRKIKGVIENEPDLDFYIFAVNISERKEMIGKHPNLKYIEGRDPNDKEVIDSLRERLKSSK